jgi:hypothetical protein
MPCEFLKDMGIKFVYVSLKEGSHTPATCSSKSAFDVLMQMAKKNEYLLGYRVFRVVTMVLGDRVFRVEILVVVSKKKNVQVYV